MKTLSLLLLLGLAVPVFAQQQDEADERSTAEPQVETRGFKDTAAAQRKAKQQADKKLQKTQAKLGAVRAKLSAYRNKRPVDPHQVDLPGATLKFARVQVGD